MTPAFFSFPEKSISIIWFQFFCLIPSNTFYQYIWLPKRACIWILSLWRKPKHLQVYSSATLSTWPSRWIHHFTWLWLSATDSLTIKWSITRRIWGFPFLHNSWLVGWSAGFHCSCIVPHFFNWKTYRGLLLQVKLVLAYQELSEELLDHRSGFLLGIIRFLKGSLWRVTEPWPSLCFMFRVRIWSSHVHPL